jgi:glycosyltransferase involved in cell wall biosynthesis
VSDTEAFLRPLGGYYRDRFEPLPEKPPRLSVLFVSPYPILPPVHGGGVFMYQTLCELVKHCDVHLVSLLDHAGQLAANEPLRGMCGSAEFIVRLEGQPGAASILPHAVREFESQELEWVIHRRMLTNAADVVQLEYTPLGQYAGGYRRLASVLFEHDVYFQSIARSLAHVEGAAAKWTARFEYLRALRYELRMLPRCDRVQVCTRENGTFLASFLPELKGRLQEGLRAGIDTAGYAFRTEGREPFTMLFLGSFRHAPNQVALDWFSREVMPCILAREPRARLAVAGSDPPPAHHFAGYPEAVEILGFVEDVKELLGRYAVFVCPILSGSGVRVKLLEAFACGIPVVSTTVGAEGLFERSGGACLLADTPEAFADRVTYLFGNPGEAASMAARARAEVTANWDMATITRKLAESYEDVIREKRATAGRVPS